MFTYLIIKKIMKKRSIKKQLELNKAYEELVKPFYTLKNNGKYKEACDELKRMYNDKNLLTINPALLTAFLECGYLSNTQIDSIEFIENYFESFSNDYTDYNTKVITQEKWKERCMLDKYNIISKVSLEYKDYKVSKEYLKKLYALAPYMLNKKQKELIKIKDDREFEDFIQDF